MGGTSQTSMQSQHSHQNQQSQPQSPMPIHRSLSQQNLQKTGSPLQQQNKGMPSLQRFATQHPLSTQQLQIQQFQQLAQARSASASPQQNPSQAMFIGHGTAPGMTPGGNNPGNFWNQANPQGGRSTPPLQQPQQQPQQQQQDKAEVRPMPFVLRRWEILPDPASIAGGNDTALSLGLFEARKV
jgi:mediator of RNA polymerase II transcription subunit 12